MRWSRSKIARDEGDPRPSASALLPPRNHRDGRIPAPGEVRHGRVPQPAPLRLPRRALPAESRGCLELRTFDLQEDRRRAEGRGRPRLRLHPDRGESRAAARVRGGGRKGRLRGLRGLRRSGRGRARAAARAGRSRRRARHRACGPQRAGLDLHTGVDVCADRGALPAPGSDLDGKPEREPRLELHELRLPHRHRVLEGHLLRQLRPARARRLPGVLRPRPGDGGHPRLHGGRRERAALSRGGPRTHAREAPRDPARRRERLGQAGGEEPHRRARLRRRHLLGCVPPGRHQPGAHRRGGLRDRRQLRDPAAAARSPHPGLHGGGRLGRAHRRRLRGGRPRADRPARRSLRRDRKESAAALESRKSDRSRRWRDARHHPRDPGARRRAPGRRRHRVPRHRHPGRAGPRFQQRRAPPGPRPRPHVGVSRATGPALRAGGRRGQPPPRQAHPRVDRARLYGPGVRKRRTARRRRVRTALLPVRTPGGPLAGPHGPLLRVPQATR